MSSVVFRTLSIVVLLSALVVGCASMPKVTMGYYLPKSSMGVTVIRTATCTTSNVPVLSTEVMQPSILYKSDFGKMRQIAIGGLGSAFGKQNAGLELYPDGRLKGFNASGTGQGGEALKALVKLAPVMGLVQHQPNLVKKACEKLREIVGNDKALTIMSRGYTDFPEASVGGIEFRQMSVDRDSYVTLQPIFGDIDASYTIIKQLPPHSGANEKSNGVVALLEPSNAIVKVSVARGQQSFDSTFEVFVPQWGTEYSLPIQKAPWFGSNEFELQVHESGKITKLRYAGSADAGGVFSTIGEAWKLGESPASLTAAEQAKAVQGEADFIYQQQRLVLCQATPASCPK
jgi:hypothetical protein